MYRVIIQGFVGVFLLVGTVGADEGDPSAKPDPNCGPRAVWVAAGLLGVSLDSNEVSKACGVSKTGSSMLCLKNGAIASGLEAEGLKMDWDALLALDSPAVLYVAGNHFLCVDPREKDSGETEKKLRVYDYPNPTLWRSKEDVEKVWKGEALVIRRPNKAVSEEGPLSRFESVLVDFGVSGEDAVMTGEFVFKNVGTEMLRILGLKKSCGCAGLEADKDEIAPGETGRIEVTFDLHGRQGYQLIQGIVMTNSVGEKSIVLSYSGFIEKPILVSPYQFDFSEVYPGGQFEQTVILTDRGDQTLQWRRGEEFVLEAFVGQDSASEDTVPEPLRPVFHLESSPYGVTIDTVLKLGLSVETAGRLGMSVPEPRPEPLPEIVVDGYPLRYLLTLKCDIPNNAPYGKYFETMILTGVRQDLKDFPVQIPIALEVKEDLYTVPSEVSFGVMKPGETRMRTFQVKRRAAGPIDGVVCRAVSDSAGREWGGKSLQPSLTVLDTGINSRMVTVKLEAPTDLGDSEALILSGYIEITQLQQSRQIKWTASVERNK